MADEVPPAKKTAAAKAPAVGEPAKKTAVSKRTRRNRRRRPDVPAPEVARAQQYLDAAKDSIKSAFRSEEIVRQKLIDDGERKAGGRGTSEEMDIRRMAIVFAGGAVDSSLKRLLRDALVPVSQVNDKAATEFTTFVQRTLRGEGGLPVDTKTLAAVLMSDAASPREALLDLYVKAKTANSLQSVSEVMGVTAALGIDDKKLTRRINAKDSLLHRLFVARNQIVHELDLQETRHAQRQRVDRSKEFTDNVVNEGLNVTQTIIDKVAAQLAG